MATTVAAVVFAVVLHLPLKAAMVRVGLPMLFTQLAISVLNDAADRDRDARSGLRRALPMGLISPRAAVLVAGLAGAISLLSSLTIDGVLPSALLAGCLVSGAGYDLWLKPTPLSPLPFAVAFPLMVVWVVVLAGHGPPAWLCFLAGVPIAVAIHLGDSLPDRRIDAEQGIRPLAVVLPARAVMPLTAALLVIGAAVMAVTVHQGSAALGILVLAASGAAGSFRMGAMRWAVASAASASVILWLGVGS